MAGLGQERIAKELIHSPSIASNWEAVQKQGLCDEFGKRSSFGRIGRDLDRRPYEPIWIVDYDGVLYCDFSRDDHDGVR